jgi:antirestriction protein ArdC
MAAMKKGNIPWRKPWTGNGTNGLPGNFVSKKTYQGVNLLLLSCAPFDCPWFVTYKQAQDLGGHVRKGETSDLVVVFAKYLDDKRRPKGDGTFHKFPMLRYSKVFNLEQCEGIKWQSAPTEQPKFTPIESAVSIWQNMPNKPELRHKEQSAYYMPPLDFINMPKPETFSAPEEYYSTLFHEAIHSTGHKSRLNREFGQRFGNEPYSKEELIAEIGAAFLCAIAGIAMPKLTENSDAYIAHWLSKLSDDSKLIVTASTKAKNAVKYILGEIEPEETDEKEA